MSIAPGFFTLTSVAQLTQAQTQAVQAQAQAAREAAADVARAQADIARAQAEQARAQAAQTRQQAQEFKENLKEQIRASIEAAREAQGQGMQIPPIPPIPPMGDFGTHVGSQDNFGEIPPQAVELASIAGMTLVFCVVGFPIARAFARWLDRRGTVAATSSDVSTRLRAIEQAVESVAVEVERISEGQRFTTRVLSERAEPVGEYLGREREAMPIGLPLDAGPGAPINARRS